MVPGYRDVFAQGDLSMSVVPPFPPPRPLVIETEVFAELPTIFRRSGVRSSWADENRRGVAVDSFLEGPSFDCAGNLWFTDIPFGRIFKATPGGAVDLVVEYDGQPNGLKFHADGTAYIADFSRGILRLNPNTGEVESVIANYKGHRFLGCNDLHFDAHGNLYFTDQGQTGLHDMHGRVFQWNAVSDELTCLIDNVPSPNGLVLDAAERVLYLAVTRANAVWRLPLSSVGTVNKAGLFLQFSGGRAGPDGLALTEQDGVVVCQTGMGLVWVHDHLGQPVVVIRSSRGLGTTNCAFGGVDRRSLYITESDTGCILRAALPEHLGIAGHKMYSGWSGAA
jgi:gluconolactonase